MEIKVLGTGCPKCKKVEEEIRKALDECGTLATIEKVTDAVEIAAYGVFGTPAVVIDGEVKSVGKIPTETEIKSWMSD